MLKLKEEKKRVPKYIGFRYNRGLYLSGVLRYRPVVNFIRSHKPTTILDIGSGLNGVAAFVREGTVTLEDLAFNSDAQSRADFVVVGSMTNLPFSDNSYDLVVSCHAMEHIPSELRPVAFSEMVRVAREWVMISCPSGREAEQADKELAEWFRGTGRAIPGWLQDHLRFGLPDLATLSRLYNCRKETCYNISAELNTILIRLESVRLFQIVSAICAEMIPDVAAFLLSRLFPGPKAYDMVLTMSKDHFL